jgi:xylitol oxidase
VERTNWAHTHSYRARTLHRPSTLEQVQEVVAAAPRLRVLGSRHSFTDMADSDEQLTLEEMPVDPVVERDAGTVSFGAALRYGELATILADEGLALANLASLPHISVAGAVATATHGSGARNGNLATSVAALQLVTSNGDVLEVRRGDPDFDGLVVGLGAAGAVTRVTLDVEPAYEVRQRVFEGLSWDALLRHFDAIGESGYSVSAFTRWGDAVDQVWVKTRVTDEPDVAAPALFGAAAATVDRHPIIGLDPVNCTPQLGLAGRWSERLPHFRMGFTPSSGEEIQSEYHVPRENAVGAIQALRRLGGSIRPLIQVTEFRWIAADELWMSPEHHNDAAAIHFTWAPEPVAVWRVLADIEAALAPFGARPHWGKLFRADAATLAPPVRAPRCVRRADRAARPARGVPQRVARDARPRRRVDFAPPFRRIGPCRSASCSSHHAVPGTGDIAVARVSAGPGCSWS